MKKLIAALAVAAGMIVAAPAEAHWYDTSWDCYAAHMPCEGNLSANEAMQFEVQEYAMNHSWSPMPTKLYAYHRINASAVWVAHWNGNAYASDQCLVDIDPVKGVPFRYYIDCTYWGTGPKS